MRNWILLALGFISFYAVAQTDEAPLQIEKIKNLEVSPQAIYTDVFSNLLIVTTDNEFIKYDVAADSMYTFAVDNNFTIDYVDANNPLNILLYSRGLNKIVTVDRNLRITSEYDLFNLDELEISMACLSSDDNLWVYDMNHSKLIKLNSQLKEEFSSPALIDIYGYELSPLSMIEKGNKVYVNDSIKGVHIFDNFAQPDNSFSQKGIQSFTIEKYKLYYAKGDFIFAYSLPTSDLDIVLPIASIGIEGGYQDLVFNKKYLFVQKEEEVLIYSIATGEQ